MNLHIDTISYQLNKGQGQSYKGSLIIGFKLKEFFKSKVLLFFFFIEHSAIFVTACGSLSQFCSI